MVRPYLRLVMIWLAIGFGIVLLLLGVLGHSLHLEQVREPESMRSLLVRFGLGWLAFGALMAAVSHALRGQRYHPAHVARVGAAVNSVLLLLIIGCLLRVGMAIVPDFDQLAFTEQLDRFYRPVWIFLGAAAALLGAPDRISGLGPPLVYAIVLMVGRIAVNWGVTQIGQGDRREEVWLGPARGTRQEDEQAVRRREAAARRVAVASYTEAKAILATTEIELTFLSLDVVGSTRMKQGEDAYVIEQAFADYRGLVERKLRRYGAYKQTWTPDGQMAAFRSAQDAVDCARDILQALPDFNRSTSRLRADFAVRAGANTGQVSTDDDTPMERMSDFTIDVAGHMQKYADPDSLWMAEAVFERLTDSSGVEANGQEVDGRKVYVWRRAD